VLRVRRAQLGDAKLFKEICLCALKDSLDGFGSTYEDAVKRDDDSWR